MLREQRKYQMKAHPWLCRMLLIMLLVSFGLFMYAIYREVWLESCYLGVLSMVLLMGLLVCHAHNVQVVKQREIHRFDLMREINRYQHFE